MFHVSVRVRFAPSPTGYLHVGGARTALFNWLYARRHGGTFVLRIEDTDMERSSEDMVTGILESLTWLGLSWDEGPEVGGPHAPYFQAARADRHRAAARRLVDAGSAYYCYCRPEELQAKRQAAEAAGGAWMYDGTCRTLSAADVDRRHAAGESRAVRVKVPAGETSFDDLVHGRITVPHATIDDFIIVRSDGTPTYQLSVVSDDIDMAITHVVRGDDHISNTPKQILLYQALGAPVPAFAHVPLILGPDKKRLSKRHGATAVGEYERQGFLPEAMVNFLALLGWSPGRGDEEIFPRDALVGLFTIEGISGGNAVFNPEKLEWFNQQHIMRLPAGDLLGRIQPGLVDAGLWDAAFDGPRHAWIERVVDLLKPRAKRLTDFVPQMRPFIVASVDRDPSAVAKYLADPAIRSHLADWRDELASIAPFDAAAIETALRARADRLAIKPAALIHATRVAVTGSAASPGIFDVLELDGRDRVLARIDDALRAMDPAVRS
ncbi:MAG: glutamate--tRNA ligase [Acidobacteria bacterium]|nr:glutamate--tRNA ligase [Acidobacteriota bacterium]